jgi:hypothetical protein
MRPLHILLTVLLTLAPPAWSGEGTGGGASVGWHNLNLLAGFRGVPFGEPEHTREDLIVYDATCPNTYYTRAQENFSFGAARLEGVAYIYNGGMFWSGSFFVYPSKIDTQVALLHLRDLFGKEHFDGVEEGRRTLTWHGRSVIIEFALGEGEGGSGIHFYDLERIKDILGQEHLGAAAGWPGLGRHGEGL